MLARFNGVHRLARHIKPPSQLRLAPIALSAQDFEAVFHPESRQRRNWKMKTNSSM